MAVTTFAEMLTLATQGMIALVNIRAGEQLTSWSLVGGKVITYQCTPTQQLTIHNLKVYDSVLMDGVALTAQVSINAVEAAPGSYWWDAANGILYVSASDSSTIWAHTIVADFTLYFCSGSYVTGQPVFLNSTLYWPYFGRCGTITRSINDIFNPSTVTSSTQIGLIHGTAFNNIFRSYRWENRTATILIGGESLSYGEYRTIYVGYTRDKIWREGDLTIELADAVNKLKTKYPQSAIQAADVTTSYTYYFSTAPVNTISFAANAVNANAVTKEAPIGNPYPVVMGKDVVVLNPPVLASNPISTGARVSLIGRGLTYVSSEIRPSATSGKYLQNIWKDQGTPTQSSGFFQNDAKGLVYSYNNPDRTGNRYYVVCGPIEASHDPYYDGPVMENPADLIQWAIQDAGITVTWDETKRLRSKFLCSLMELQILWNQSGKTLQDLCDGICRSSGSVLFQGVDGKYVFMTLAPDYSSYITLDEAWGDFHSFDAQTYALQVYPKVTVGYGLLSLDNIGCTKATNISNIDVRSSTEFTYTATIPEFQSDLATSQEFELRGTYLKTQAGAVCLANRMARWNSNVPMTMRMDTDFRWLSLDIGSTVLITKSVKPVADPTWNVFAVITSVGINIENCIVHLEGREQFKDRQALLGTTGAPAWASATTAQKRLSGFIADDTGLVAASDNSAFKASLEW